MVLLSAIVPICAHQACNCWGRLRLQTAMVMRALLGMVVPVGMGDSDGPTPLQPPTAQQVGQPWAQAQAALDDDAESLDGCSAVPSPMSVADDDGGTGDSGAGVGFQLNVPPSPMHFTPTPIPSMSPPPTAAMCPPPSEMPASAASTDDDSGTAEIGSPRHVTSPAPLETPPGPATAATIEGAVITPANFSANNSSEKALEKTSENSDSDYGGKCAICWDVPGSEGGVVAQLACRHLMCLQCLNSLKLYSRGADAVVPSSVNQSSVTFRETRNGLAAAPKRECPWCQRPGVLEAPHIQGRPTAEAKEQLQHAVSEGRVADYRTHVYPSLPPSTPPSPPSPSSPSTMLPTELELSPRAKRELFSPTGFASALAEFQADERASDEAVRFKAIMLNAPRPQVSLGLAEDFPTLQASLDQALSGSSGSEYEPSPRTRRDPALSVPELRSKARGCSTGQPAAARPMATGSASGYIPTFSSDASRQVLWAPSKLSAASADDCDALQREFRKELGPIFDKLGHRLLFWTADQQEYAHFVKAQERAWQHAESRIASMQQTVNHLLVEMPDVDDDSYSDWQRERGPQLDMLAHKLRDAKAGRLQVEDYYFLGRLHVVKNGMIGFFKAYAPAGLRDSADGRD